MPQRKHGTVHVTVLVSTRSEKFLTVQQTSIWGRLTPHQNNLRQRLRNARSRLRSSAGERIWIAFESHRLARPLLVSPKLGEKHLHNVLERGFLRANEDQQDCPAFSPKAHVMKSLNVIQRLAGSSSIGSQDPPGDTSSYRTTVAPTTGGLALRRILYRSPPVPPPLEQESEMW
jgi:hypothetical protein